MPRGQDGLRAIFEKIGNSVLENQALVMPKLATAQNQSNMISRTIMRFGLSTVRNHYRHRKPTLNAFCSDRGKTYGRE